METRKRKPRSDALRNRERLIAAAKDVLGKGGPDASLEAVAREAGVGIGTLYRNFPDRAALFHAVFLRELEQLVTTADSLDRTDDPVGALRHWLHANVATVETKRGMLGALSLVMSDDLKRPLAPLSDRINAAVARLLEAAASQGQIRDDVTADDVLQTMYALCYARPPGPDWRAQVLRLLDIFVDGLRR
ncbi:transcriptional regulator, TetR family [Loktanella atrilutea]|uniref:Transcriptional regulator, TetR family n=1 Tax=Loktanella atrilutea TaxID=366533 RepID=A0A1M5DB78_LOKAT|nr:TetR/AcrR family transcriptional regulator [Loktanella atrilutea]SHF63932.1 transcriptional regulator, TetR family [Loktanella atrilutea]